MCLPPGDLSCVNVHRGSNSSFLAFKVQVPITGDALGHFLDEALSDVALPRRLLGIVLDQQIEDRRVGDMLGEIVRTREVAAGKTANRFQSLKMRRLRRPRSVGRRVIRSAPRGGLR